MNLQALATYGLVAMLAVGAAAIFLLIPTIKRDQAVDELVYVAYSASRALYTAGPAAITSCEDLVDEGYFDEDTYTDCADENTYGNDITVAGVVATGIANITYTFDTLAQCNYGLNNLDERIDQLTGTPACSAAFVLSFSVEPIRG